MTVDSRRRPGRRSGSQGIEPRRVAPQLVVTRLVAIFWPPGSRSFAQYCSIQVPQPPRKLSFKEKHALATLPGEIEKLEAEITALTVKLADAQLFATDRAAFDKATARLATVQSNLESAESRWLDLEERRATIEG